MMKKNKKLLLIIGAAAVLLVGLMLLLIFLPKGDSEETATYDEGISMETSVDENGVHQASINTDENGNIDNNSYGTLMEYVPAEIKTIHLENSKGTLDINSYTPVDDEGKTDTTEYTIVGFEDYEIQGGVPDEIAHSAASIEFLKVATLEKSKSSEYGFDSPRSVVTVEYTDGTKCIITVGDDAPQAAGTYIKFGSGDTVYLVSSDTVTPFDYGLTDLMSLTINDSASDTTDSQASRISISGTAFSDTIVLEPNTDGKTSASYIIKEPVNGYANESESSKVEGGIRGLYAESVKMVNPSDSQLSDLGLSNPYAEVKAEYPDTSVHVLSSAPDDEGKVNVMVSGGKLVYVMDSSKVPWVTTSYEKLVSEYVLYPKMTALSGITLETGGKTYKLGLSTEEADDDSSASETKITYNDREIAAEKFSTFYDAISLIELADAKSDSTGSNAVAVIKYTYAEDNSTDTVKFYDSTDRYAAELNGEIIGHVHKAAVDNLAAYAEELVKTID